MRKKRKHKTTTDKTDECKTAKRRYRATSSRQKTATKRWKTTTNDRHKKCKKTTRKHKTTKDSKQPQKRWKPAANRPHRRTTSETKQNRYRDTEKKSLKDLKQTERDAQRPQRRKMWIRIIINKDAQQQKGHKKPSKTTTQAERPRRETKRLERQQKKMKNSHEETLNDHKKVQIDHKDAWNDNKGHPQPPQRDTKTTTKLHTCTPSTDTRKRRMHRMTQLRTDSTQTQNSDGVKSENQNNHKDTHTKPQRDYKQTAKLNRLKILKGSKKWTRTDVETFGLCLRRFWLWCRRVLNVSAGPSSTRQHTN